MLARPLDDVSGSKGDVRPPARDDERSLSPLAQVESFLKVSRGSAALPLPKGDGSAGAGSGGQNGDRSDKWGKNGSSNGSGGREGLDLKAGLAKKGIVLPTYGAGSYRVVCPEVGKKGDLIEHRTPVFRLFNATRTLNETYMPHVLLSLVRSC